MSLNEDTLTSDLSVPSSFASVVEAKCWTDIIANATFRLRSELIRLAASEALKIMNPNEDFSRWILCCDSLSRVASLRRHPRLHQRWENLRDAHVKFMAAIRKLTETTHGDKTILLNMMEIQAFSTQLINMGFRETREMQFDRLEPDYARIVMLIEGYLQHRHEQDQQQQGYNTPVSEGSDQDGQMTAELEPYVLPAAYFMVLKCRKASLRRQAIALLSAVNRHDNPYNKRALHAFALQIQALEEARARSLDLTFVPSEDYEASAIPESARVVEVKMSGIVGKPGKARMILARFRHESNGSILVWEEEFDVK